MAGQSLVPAGDFRTTYAADTTIFPTTTSRNVVIVGIVLICFAPLRAQRILAQPADPDRHLRHRRARPQHSGRLHRPDLDRPCRLLRLRRLHLGLSLETVRGPGVLRHPAGGRRHRRRRADVRPAGGAAEGSLSRDRDAGGAVHPAGFLLARRMVHRRRVPASAEPFSHLRLYAARRPAVFLRRAGLCGGQLPAGHQSDAHRATAARWSRCATTISPPRSWASISTKYRTLSFGARGVLRRHRRRALRALSGRGVERRLRHRPLDPVPRHGHHRRRSARSWAR